MLLEITNNICLAVMIKVIREMRINNLLKQTEITFVWCTKALFQVMQEA